MIKIKIDKNNHCYLTQKGEIEELLGNIRMLDTMREHIFLNVCDEAKKTYKKKYPNVSEEQLSKIINSNFKQILEEMTVISTKK